MEKNLSLYKKAKDRLIKDIDLKSKILDVGPLDNPLFNKNEANIYFADIKPTEVVKNRYSYFNDKRLNKIVDIDYVIEESYEKTFKNNNIKFDYVIFSHVFEHIPNPINILLDVSTILSLNGKLCLLLPDKEFTFDHYRENTTFADWYDVYIRGEEYSLPRLVLDSMLETNKLNNPVAYWNKTFTKIPDSTIKSCLNQYQKYIDDDKLSFDGHRWVFTDRSFLKILEDLYKVNLMPYNLIRFYPTAHHDNTFGLILELDYSVQKNPLIREKIINDINEISENIYKKRFEIEANKIIKENFKLREKLNKIKNIHFKNLNDNQIDEYIVIYYSDEFDTEYYIKKYGLNNEIDPIIHFLKVGVNEGFNPSPNFDTEFYLKTNEDVRKSGMNPFVHYLKYGKKESRLPKQS